MTSLGELEVMCKNIPNFLGVFLANDIKSLKNKIVSLADCSLIVNYDDINDSITHSGHWVAFVKRNSKSYYFDSFGAPILHVIKDNLGIQNGVHGMDIKVDKLQIQSFSGEDKTYCGYYCYLYICLMNKGFNHKRILKTLDD